eukprot:757961_1
MTSGNRSPSSDYGKYADEVSRLLEKESRSSSPSIPAIPDPKDWFEDFLLDGPPRTPGRTREHSVSISLSPSPGPSFGSFPSRDVSLGGPRLFSPSTSRSVSPDSR